MSDNFGHGYPPYLNEERIIAPRVPSGFSGSILSSNHVFIFEAGKCTEVKLIKSRDAAST